ncbi:hypothetical protein ACLX1H_010006 [Fusarium chlamydosporum]
MGDYNSTACGDGLFGPSVWTEGCRGGFDFTCESITSQTVEKRRILIVGDKPISKESTSGPFSRGFFVWLNSLLISGWATVLTNNDLPAIYEKLSSEKLAVRFGKAWAKATSRSKKPSLFKTTVSVLRWELLGIIPPRIGMIALSISQPFLISNALRFLTMPASESTTNLGYGLIGAFAFVFIGSAILTAWYEHLTFRASAMVRGGLISMIYSKMMKLPTDDLAESSAVTLMGNDVETLIEKLHFLLVESWANTLTVAIAMYMLAAQLGAVCVAPIVTGIICLFLTGSIGKMMVSRQIKYQKATQDRINLTNEVLSSMKPVKMLGLSERFQSIISQKRDEEISTGKHYRVINVYLNMITNCNVGMTEAITFGAYAIAAKLGNGEPFSAAQAITALSILGVMMDPLSHLLGSIPGSFSVFGCFTRMEDFFKLEERVDRRQIHGRYKESSRTSHESPQHFQESFNSTAMKDIQVGADGSKITIAGGNFNWGEKAVLQDINTAFPSHKDGSLTMLVGPVGSGKSSLLKAILGETTSSNGSVSLNSSEVAFCDQTPWVMNATIRANIIAESKGYDSAWFGTVISACDLTIDLGRLPEGDLTQVGEQGVKLSGGQKQRIAIARAVYSRKPIAIFDDVFSGLDKVTEQIIFTQVFGKDGLLRKNGTTIILATHAVNRLPESDFVVVLDKGGRLIEQGTYSDLRSGTGYIHNLDISSHDDHDDQTQTDTNSEPENEKADTENQVQEEEPAEVPSDRKVAACFGAAGLAMAAVSWFAISIPFVITILVLIQRFYVRTSKQLRLIEIEHKAPLFSHFLETINGLATIRAFGWTQPYTDKVLTRIDDAQKPSYLLNCIQRWLTLVLDMVVAFLTIILVIFAVTLREKINPSLLGIALVNMMRLGTNMKGIVLNWSTLETSLGAIARIRMFCSSAPSEEKPGEGTNPGESWPKGGGLEVENVDVQYEHTTEPVLRGLSFSVKPGEKLGLCGRSGSGKSSFVQALLRMAEIVNGQITLDGEDISVVPRHLIRQRLSCLTQDPFVFGDSIRANLDPCNVSSDDEIRNALERVGIWSVIRTKVDDDKDPLDEKMDENFLSHGQRQLFCLARALLKKSSLLILDEPTSRYFTLIASPFSRFYVTNSVCSVDTQTDARMQEVIRTEFSDCTIIMIAHRIDTLLDFDKVAVLDKGSLVEFGAPQELLKDEGGAFTRLYRANKGKKTES